MARRNSAIKFYVNGRRAQRLDGLSDLAGNALSAYDTAVTRATVGLQRRALPLVSRSVRQSYNIKAGALSGKYRVETGTAGRRGERSDFISIWASARKIPLTDFGGRWAGRRSAGATAAIERGGTKTYEGAFIATVKGRRAIRVRQFESTGRRAPRGPLRMLRGPSPFEMLAGTDHDASQSTKRAVMSELRVFYSTELRRQFKLTRS
jgi:hypothetical protein